MRNKWKTGLLWPVVFFAGVLVWVVISLTSDPDERRSPSASSSQGARVAPAESEMHSLGKSQKPGSDLSPRLLGDLELLRGVHGEKEGQAGVQRMLAWLEQAPVEDSTKAIVEVLRSGEDAFLFGRFSPGGDGFLSSYPTVRAALLDLLEKLNPDQAIVMSKEILDTSENPDEWALSLRTLTRHGTSVEDREFLQLKVQDLLHQQSWLEEPSFGFLHAFDAAVLSGRIQTLERLGELAGAPPNRAVGHAAILSVDRFFQTNSTAGVAFVSDHPEFLGNASGFRASLMARANPTDLRAMAATEAYLESPSFTEAEKRTFFEVFPNFNSTFSHNLIAQSRLLSRPEMRERGVAAFTRLSNWLSDHRYPEFEDEINSAVIRLAGTWKLDQ